MWDAIPRKYGRKAAIPTSPVAPWAGESSWLRFPANNLPIRRMLDMKQKARPTAACISKLLSFCFFGQHLTCQFRNLIPKRDC